MKFLSVKYRITLGLVSILLSAMFLVIFSGFGPDARQATMRGRARLCESIAIYSSVLIGRNDLDRLEQCLSAVVERDDALLSAGVRRTDGRLIVQIGDHVTHWLDDADQSTESQVKVPLWSGKSTWGIVELRFRPVAARGITGLIYSPWTIHMALVAVITFVIFSLYLRMVLRQLDPSKAIPKRVRSALDALAEGLLVTNKKGRVVLANESFAAWAGQRPEKLIGRDATKFPWKLIENADAAGSFPWIRAIEERIPQANCQLLLSDTNNNQLTLVANSSPVLGHDGEYRGVLTSFEDVTELEQHKVELVTAKQAADDANQAKSEFLARMSHEIRTPMNAILGYTDVLRRGFAESEEQRSDYLQTIHKSGEHLLALINDILDLSKVEAGRMDLELARHSPHELLSQVISVLRGKAEEKQLSLRYEPEGKLPQTILTDAVRLRQAIINLVGNAIKFTETGSVRVVARLIRQPKTLVAIDVIDTGIGMSEAASNRIFDPFSQADTTITRRYGGTGLGLSISRQLAEQMGGDVTVESQLGKGTTFTITIDPGPLANVPLVDFDEAEFERSDACEPEKDQIELPPSHILVVDDGEENRQLVSLFLGRVGIDVASAENGQVAVEMVLENDFDAILMDMQMPVMDGITATKRLRELGCTTPIIALTANVMKDDEERCREAGFTGFLTKPISMDRLIETLRDVLTVTANARDPLPAKTLAVPSAIFAVAKPKVSRPSGDVEKSQRILDRVTDLANEALDASPVISSLATDDPVFQAIVARFVVRLQERLMEMRQAESKRNHVELAELAHWLKGTGGTVGFHEFTTPAAALQSSAEAGDAEGIAANLRAIEGITSRIRVTEADCVDITCDPSIRPTPTPRSSEDVIPSVPQKRRDVDDCQRIYDAVTDLCDEVHTATPVISSLPTNDPEFHQIVEGFVGRLQERVLEMRQAASKGDFTELAELAHWLKGAGGSVGFSVFTTPAAALQSGAESRDEDKVALNLNAIEEIAGRIQVGNEPAEPVVVDAAQ